MRNIFKSFLFAIEGIFVLFKTERNAQIHLLASLIVIVWASLLEINSAEWYIVILCIVVVFAMEGVNTAVETLADLISESYHPLIKKAKDLAAGAVLIVAIGVSIIGFRILIVPTIQYLLYY